MRTYKLKLNAFGFWLFAASTMALSNCALPPQNTQVALEAHTSNVSTDLYIHGLATKFKNARDGSGMSGVTTMIQECYRSAVRPFSFRECMILDAVGRRVDLDAVKSFGGPALPYWSNATVTRRWEQNRRPANFPDARTAVQFMANGSEAVMLDLLKSG